MKNGKIVLSKVAHSQRLKSFRASAALILTTLILLVAAATTAATAQTYTDLHNFDGTHGANPAQSDIVAQGQDGNLYGTAPLGGTNDVGVVFKITPGGKLKVLYNFDGDGSIPESGLTLGTDGNFYGTTYWGAGSGCWGGHGCGTIFKITKSGSLTTPYSFTGGTDGGNPSAPPIQGTDGNFYGTTAPYPSPGTAYKITPSGTFTLLASLPGLSYAPLLQATDGNFYGTTENGGKSCTDRSSGCGTVFKIRSNGVVTIIHKFDGTDGEYPEAPLIQGSDGNFYGTTVYGGSYGWGVVFVLTPQGALTVLHNFPDNGIDGDEPSAGLVQATDGNFYGTATEGGTLGGGVIFQITPDGAYTILYNLDGAHGELPYSTPMQHTDGKIYGLTAYGGIDGQGVVYSLDMGLGPFVRLLSTSGKVGKTIEVLGQGFTGTTAVSFNGTAATFTVVRDTYLKATVPSGATTGPVTVTTPGATLNSNTQFRVTPVLKTFSPTSGPVGTLVTLTGTSFTQTTKVGFGGVHATSFTVDSDTQVTATVPTGAKTGRIAVTTAGGKAWSRGVFTVMQ